MDFHEPAMLTEVLRHVRAKPRTVICDGTLGTAGHALHLVQSLEAKAGQGVFIGLDRDPVMIGRARSRMADLDVGGHVRLLLLNRRYDELPEVLKENGLEGTDATLLDLGTHRHQLEEPQRGFSFSKEGPLDGRFNPEEPGTRPMSELVNKASEKELRTWLRDLADERFAGRIARRIVEARAKKAFETTTELAALVRSCYPASSRAAKIHPATRTFQALRIVANDELRIVERGIRNAIGSLNPGGVLCVISYHSGEDRLTKRLFDEAGSPRPDPTNPYSATTREGLRFRVESRGAEKPTPEETERNPSARSARLRVLHRLEAS